MPQDKYLPQKYVYVLNFILALGSASLFQFFFLGATYYKESVVLTLILFVLGSNSSLRVGIFIATVIAAIFYPVATISHGLLQPSLLAVILESNNTEAVNFISTLPSKYIIRATIFILIYLLAILFYKKLNYKISSSKAIFTVFILILPVAEDVKIGFQNRINPLINEYKEITESINGEPNWALEKNSEGYHSYVVLIGESMRRDLSSVYHFPIDTMPFLNSVPKKVITDYIGTAINTSLSVPRVLSVNHDDGTFDRYHNAVTLANASGYQTYWISSQGYSGVHNLSASSIAKYSKHGHFMEMYSNDADLMPEIKKVIALPEKKVVFIHIMGSHEHPCARLFDYPVRYESSSGDALNCYLTTYNKTDDFIKNTYTELKNTEKSFSMVYFSDHALNMEKGAQGKMDFIRDEAKKESYKIPFVLMSSDDVETQEYAVTRSAYNFMNFYASWLGVKTNLTVSDYDMFSNQSDDPMVMGYDKKLRRYNDLKKSINALDIESIKILTTSKN